METLQGYISRLSSHVKPYTAATHVQKYVHGRFEAAGFASQGQKGAEAYLAIYGKGIGLEKVQRLARTAEQFGYVTLAMGFWIAAFKLEYSQAPDTANIAVVMAKHQAVTNAMLSAATGFWAAQQEVVIQANQAEVEHQIAKVAGRKLDEAIRAAAVEQKLLDPWAALPQDVRPGWLVTMQPTDARRPREFYVNDPRYCGQPKKDGHRMVVFASVTARMYQPRLSKGYEGTAAVIMREPGSAVIDAALQDLAFSSGIFALDCEQVYYSWRGSEHMTAPQAAAINLAEGHGAIPPRVCLVVFDCLYANGEDLRSQSFEERARIARWLTSSLAIMAPGSFEWLQPAYTTKAKQALTQQQSGEKREGEIWRRVDAPYTPGKTNSGRGPDYIEPIVRTKYYIDDGMEVVVQVTGLTATSATKVKREFGAVEVCDPTTGKAMGSIGTGFSFEQQDELVAAWQVSQATARPLLIKVSAPNVTEYGMLRMAVYKGLVEVTNDAQ